MVCSIRTKLRSGNAAVNLLQLAVREQDSTHFSACDADSLGSSLTWHTSARQSGCVPPYPGSTHDPTLTVSKSCSTPSLMLMQSAGNVPSRARMSTSCVFIGILSVTIPSHLKKSHPSLLRLSITLETVSASLSDVVSAQWYCLRANINTLNIISSIPIPERKV